MTFFVRRKLLISALFALLALAIPLSASALDCINVSRPPGPDSATGLVTTGNWLWFPSYCNIYDCGGFTPDPEWIFLPPGSGVFIQGVLSNGAFHGQYINPGGKGTNVAYELLGRSAICLKGVPNRQTYQGIQNECTGR